MNERGDIGRDCDRLVERTDQVLPLGKVHRGLAADCRVDLREQRGRCLHHRDAAVIDGGREPRGVADDAATERDDCVTAQQPSLHELSAERVDGGERLGRFAVAHDDVRPRQALAERVENALLRDDDDLTTAAEHALDLLERTRADRDVVGRFGQRDGYAFHDCSPSITCAATSCTV